MSGTFVYVFFTWKPILNVVIHFVYLFQYSNRLTFHYCVDWFLHKQIKTYFSPHKLTKRNLKLCQFYSRDSSRINEFVGTKKSASHC
jgi:hypothetical protein